MRVFFFYVPSFVFLWVKRECPEVTEPGLASGLVNSLWSGGCRSIPTLGGMRTEFMEFSLRGRLTELFYSHLGTCKARLRVEGACPGWRGGRGKLPRGACSGRLAGHLCSSLCTSVPSLCARRPLPSTNEAGAFSRVER